MFYPRPGLLLPHLDRTVVALDSPPRPDLADPSAATQQVSNPRGDVLLPEPRRDQVPDPAQRLPLVLPPGGQRPWPPASHPAPPAAAHPADRACPREASPDASAACHACRPPPADHNSATITAVGICCPELLAASSRTCSRRLRPSAVSCHLARTSCSLHTAASSTRQPADITNLRSLSWGRAQGNGSACAACATARRRRRRHPALAAKDGTPCSWTQPTYHPSAVEDLTTGWTSLVRHRAAGRRNLGSCRYRTGGDWRGYSGPKPRQNRTRYTSAPPRMAVRSRRRAGADRSRSLHNRQSHHILRACANRPGGRCRGNRDTCGHPLRPLRAALEAGKHVLVEKPLTPTVSEAVKLAGVAERFGLVLMCDHTYCYTPAVRRIRELIRNGEIGDVQFVELGPDQPRASAASDVDVLWDLAPHDLSILDFVLPENVMPVAVAAHAGDPIGAGRNCLAYLSVWLSTGALAHVHVNWLSPTKIRTTVFGGSRRTIVWDDMNPSARIMVHDRGVDRVLAGSLTQDDRRQALISYRVGDIHVPGSPRTRGAQFCSGRICRCDHRASPTAHRCPRGHARSRASRSRLAERRPWRHPDPCDYGGRYLRCKARIRLCHPR